MKDVANTRKRMVGKGRDEITKEDEGCNKYEKENGEYKEGWNNERG